MTTSPGPGDVPLVEGTGLVRRFLKEARGPVLDPFGGSGTTAIAAAQAGVRAVSLEAVPVLAFLTNARFRPSDRGDALFVAAGAQPAWLAADRGKPLRPLGAAVVGDARRLPFADGTFGGIVTSPPYLSRYDYVGQAAPLSKLFDPERAAHRDAQLRAAVGRRTRKSGESLPAHSGSNRAHWIWAACAEAPAASKQIRKAIDDLDMAHPGSSLFFERIDNGQRAAIDQPLRKLAQDVARGPARAVGHGRRQRALGRDGDDELVVARLGMIVSGSGPSNIMRVWSILARETDSYSVRRVLALSCPLANRMLSRTASYSMRLRDMRASRRFSGSTRSRAGAPKLDC